ncbi:MAG: hypothetical protein HC898_01350 [Phycisphaerales bacterium]|nr:hypothetical protein [Phycisphaerales bacterium]
MLPADGPYSISVSDATFTDQSGAFTLTVEETNNTPTAEFEYVFDIGLGKLPSVN